MKIETKPLPEAGAGREKYPFHRLEVGQCFHVTATERRALQQTLSSCARKPSLRGKKFATRCDERGVGVWRVA